MSHRLLIRVGCYLGLASLALCMPVVGGPLPTPFYQSTSVGLAVNVVAGPSLVFVAGGEKGVFILRKRYNANTAPGSIPSPALEDTGLKIEMRADDLVLDGQDLYVLNAGSGELRVYDTRPVTSTSPRAPVEYDSEIRQDVLATTTWSSLTGGSGFAWVANGKGASGDKPGGIWGAVRGTGDVDELLYAIPVDSSRRYYEIDAGTVAGRSIAIVITQFSFGVYGLSMLERKTTGFDVPFRLSDELLIDDFQDLSESPSALVTGLLAEGDFEDGAYYFTRGDELAVTEPYRAERFEERPQRPTLHPTPFRDNDPYLRDPETVLELGQGETSAINRPYHVTVERRLGLVLAMDKGSDYGRPDHTALVACDVAARGTEALLGVQPLSAEARFYYGADLEDGFAYVVGKFAGANGFQTTGLQVFDLRAIDPPTVTPTPTITRTPTRTRTATRTPLTPIPTDTPTRTKTPITPASADLNHSGTTTKQDLRELLRQWESRR